MDKLDFLNIVFLENEVKDYLVFILILLFGYILISPISSYLRKIIFRIVGNKNHVGGKDEFDTLLKKPLYYFLLLIIFYFAFNSLSFPESWGLVDSSELGIKMILSKGFSFFLIITIFWTILQSVEYLGVRLKFRAEQTESKVDDQLIPFAIEIGKVLVFIFAVVVILANVFDQNVTALAAGLGVGGVAVALASKESLENLLGSFTISVSYTHLTLPTSCCV